MLAGDMKEEHLPTREESRGSGDRGSLNVGICGGFGESITRSWLINSVPPRQAIASMASADRRPRWGTPALKSAARAAIVMPAVFALADKAIGQPQTSLFA